MLNDEMTFTIKYSRNLFKNSSINFFKRHPKWVFENLSLNIFPTLKYIKLMKKINELQN